MFLRCGYAEKLGTPYSVDFKTREQATMFKRNIAIGHLDGDIELRACGDMGVETPWKKFAFTVDDIQFYNYDAPTPNLASVDLSTFAMRDELDKLGCHFLKFIS